MIREIRVHSCIMVASITSMRSALEEDVMSVILVTGSLLKRLGINARSLLTEDAPERPNPEAPQRKRERLRQEVVARGGRLDEIETITGDCGAQTAQQIADLTRWLAQR
jgi:hypothetical protein